VSTIRSSREIDQVFRAGHRAAHPLVIALVAPTPPGRDLNGRVAFIAGKKTGNAVMRNRSRRVLRAAAALAKAPWPGYDVLLIARDKTAQSSSDEVRMAIQRVLAKAGVTP